MLQEHTIVPAHIEDGTQPIRTPGARLDAETAYDVACRSRDLGERVVADTLDTLMWIADAAVAFASRVDESGGWEITMLRRAPGHDNPELPGLLARLPQLEPIDPFSPRRATACGATLMSVADVGGREAYARSLHGQHLRRHGYGVPAVMYLRRAGAIVSGVALARTFDAPALESSTLRRLHEFHPLVEHALVASGEPAQRPTALARLTTREAQIAELVAGGASNAVVAAALGLREATVKTHLTSAYAKLGVRSRTQLAVALSRQA